MLASDFQVNLRKLNKNLRIWCGDSDSTPASIFFVQRGEFEQVCAVDKQWLPDHTMFKKDGTILKGGWRRPIHILIKRGLVDRFQAQKVFNTYFPVTKSKLVRPTYKPETPIKNSIVKREITQDELNWLKKRQGA